MQNNLKNFILTSPLSTPFTGKAYSLGMDSDVKNMQKQLSEAFSAPAQLNARTLNISYPQTLSRHWVQDNAYATAFFNSLSVVFPHGEAFMIRSVAPWRSKATEALHHQITGFIQQEAGHSHEHDVMNDAITKSGYNIAPLERAIRQFVAAFRSSSATTRLGATMCIEHITAIVAAEILANDSHLAQCSDEMRAVWLWHSLEEVEHKAVAFDVWHHATRDWSSWRRWMVRSAMMIAISASFFVNRTRGQIELLRQDGLSTWPALRGMIRFGFSKGGIGRNILRPWAQFLKPRFHPWHIDDHGLIAKGEAIVAKVSAAQAQADKPAERRKKLRLAQAA